MISSCNAIGHGLLAALAAQQVHHPTLCQTWYTRYACLFYCSTPEAHVVILQLQPRALRSRRPAAAAGVAAAVKSVLGAAQDVKDASAVCTQPALKAIDITAQNQVGYKLSMGNCYSDHLQACLNPSLCCNTYAVADYLQDCTIIYLSLSVYHAET